MAIQAQMHCENLGFRLDGPQDHLLVDNGCGLDDFYLNFQPQHRHHPNMQYQQLQNRPEWNQHVCFNNRFLRPEDQSTVFSEEIMQSQIEKQSKEIDLIINLQNERYRLALQEQRKQQITSLLESYESKAQVLFQQKDEEIAKAINRTIELEFLLKQFETENQTWQRVAKENEAIIISLKNTVEQFKKLGGGNGNGVDDAESCCEIVMNSTATVAAEQTNANGMTCKICNFRSSCVILLPCRHLCSCNVCEAFIESCPVCNLVKKASIEVFL
ncbi:hypothetical protein ACH5RR_021891 [Cinchona calisaya]|uniref:RING-type domain-containing protein n=1 Tax=Cinchona calisaya TaxID=153742 RepID=A0ABD2Z807_9GENT